MALTTVTWPKYTAGCSVHFTRKREHKQEEQEEALASMPAYHSAFNEAPAKEVCGCALLPIKTRARGPAPPAPDDQEDIVDEIIQLFRANVLFTNFEIKGNADRVLVYGTLFVHLCLKKLDKCATKADGAFAYAIHCVREERISDEWSDGDEQRSEYSSRLLWTSSRSRVTRPSPSAVWCARRRARTKQVRAACSLNAAADCGG